MIKIVFYSRNTINKSIIKYDIGDNNNTAKNANDIGQKKSVSYIFHFSGRIKSTISEKLKIREFIYYFSRSIQYLPHLLYRVSGSVSSVFWERPWKAIYCGKTFSRKKNSTEHTKVCYVSPRPPISPYFIEAPTHLLLSIKYTQRSFFRIL